MPSNVHVPWMADTKNPSEPEQAPESGRNRAPGPHPAHDPREELIRDPNLNQADNWRGSLDQTQGSQTGSEVDLIPEP
jgi:hypothetical protein